MKIKYFKLTNYAGIKYGINNTEFELKDIPSGLIKLTGNNGCGKSTTLHSLHIFSDDKTFLIKKEDGTYEEAEKELIIEHSGAEYHIIHQYNNKGSKKSFISKNGTELNANGNVTTFEDIVEKEFSLNNNTIGNSVIGVSEVNFIDLTSSERKKEISRLLPNIDIYDKNYKKANDSLNGCKKHIQMLSKLISDNGSVEQIDQDIIDIRNKIQPLEDEIQTYKNNLLESEKYKAIVESKITEMQSSISNAQMYITNNEQEYNNAKSIIDKYKDIEIDTDINAINNKLSIEQNKHSILQEEINNLKIEISNMNNEWNNYNEATEHNKNIQINRDKIKEQISSIEEEIKAINKSIEEISNVKIEDYTNQNTIDHINRVGISIKNELETLSNSYFCSIDEKTELEVYNDIETIKNKINLYNEKAKELTKYQNYLSIFNSMSNTTNNNELNNISLSDGCSFNKCALQYKSLVDFYNQKCNDLGSMLEKHKEKYEQYVKFLEIHNNYSQYYNDRYELAKVLKLNVEEFSKLNLKHVLAKLRTIKKEIEENLFKISKLPEKESIRNNKIEYINQLKQNLDSIKLIEVKNINFTKEDIIEKQNSITNKNEEIVNSNRKISVLNKKLQDAIEYSNLSKYRNIIDKYEVELNNFNNTNTSINNNRMELQNCENQINTINRLIVEKSNIIQTFNKEIKELDDKKAVIKDQLSNKTKLDTEIEERQLVISALHPTKGIASLLIKSYLNNIENICNEILDKTFDGAYKIYLENEEKDFFIKVYEKSTNRYIDDVKLASSGQQAIVKLVLSIALAKCSIGDKIFLKLDEADSVLDEQNIMSLETILTGINKLLGIEQIFIVTHNSAISVADMKVVFDRDEQRYDIERLD